MQIKDIFVKTGEEGYALDAFTSDKLAELGYRETARDTETHDRIYEKTGEDSIRLVRTAGSAKHGIVDFGSIVLQTQTLSGQWQEEARLSLEDFVNSPAPFADAIATAPAAAITIFRACKTVRGKN